MPLRVTLITPGILRDKTMDGKFMYNAQNYPVYILKLLVEKYDTIEQDKSSQILIASKLDRVFLKTLGTF